MTERNDGRSVLILAAALLAVGAGVGTAAGDDWPQWRGPDRSGVSAEKGLLKRWPEGGPRLLWSRKGLGAGYASASVADGRVYTTGSKDKTGYVTCCDTSGKLLWRRPYGPEGYANGPYARSTPTVDGGRLFLMTALGQVVCLDAKTGATVWRADLVKRFGARQPAGKHGVSENVLVVGDVVVCTPGGQKGSAAGLDRKTGATLWVTSEIKETSGFNQPLLLRRGDRDVAVIMTERSLFGVDAADGDVLWRHDWGRVGGQCFTPVLAGDVLYAPVGKAFSGVGFELSADGAKLTAQWTQHRMTCHHGGVVAVGGYLYGTHGHFRMACLDARNGRIMYETPKRVGLASTIAADGMLIQCFENGRVVLAPATPQGYRPTGKFKLPLGKGTCWAHPSLSGGVLYVRRGDVLMAFDVSGKAPTTRPGADRRSPSR